MGAIFGLCRGYLGAILGGLYRGHVGVIFGLYRGYIGVCRSHMGGYNPCPDMNPKGLEVMVSYGVVL